MSTIRLIGSEPLSGSNAGPATPEIRAEFGKRLRRFARDKGFTQSELARRCDPPMRRDNVSKYVNGQAMPTHANLLALTKALGVRIEDLLPQAEAMQPDEAPKIEIRSGPDGKMWLSIRGCLRTSTALKIMELATNDGLKTTSDGK